METMKKGLSVSESVAAVVLRDYVLVEVEVETMAQMEEHLKSLVKSLGILEVTPEVAGELDLIDK